MRERQAQPHTRRTRHTASARGFTIVELLVSLAVIGLLIGLVIVGVRQARSFAKGATGTVLANNLDTALREYKKQTGIMPPMVKDRANPAISSAQLVQVANPRTTIQVYKKTVAADQDFLRGPSVGAASFQGPTPANPFRDNRYSTRSLAYYVTGSLSVGVSNTISDVPVDGVDGPGFYKPLSDGSFDVPSSLLKPAPADRKKTGTPFEPFVQLTGNVNVFTDPADPVAVELRDKGGAPIRYYRWVTGREEPANSGTFVVTDLADLNVPFLVGRKQTNVERTPAERDLEKNASLRNATYAVVLAGANGVFGDESLDVIQRALSKALATGLPVDEERRLRIEAEADNIVKAGAE